MMKKEFAFIDFAITTVTIIETESNLFVSLRTKTKNLLVIHFSAGQVGMRGKKKKTPLAGELLGKKLGKLIRMRKQRLLGIQFKGALSPAVRGFLRGLMYYKLNFFFLEDIKCLAHNGVRLKKPRRL